MRKGQISQLASVLLLMLIAVSVMVFVFPMRDSVADLKLEKAAVADELQGIQSDYEALLTLSEEVAKSEATKQALQTAVPTGATQDQLILDLSEMAEDAGFDLNAMNFSLSVDQELGNTVQVAANVSGSYDDLIDFLQKIETSSRLMQVESMSVQLTSTSAVVFNLSIEAYYQ